MSRELTTTVPRLYAGGVPQALGGLCALAVVMGVGRFAYTALLPDMMHAHAFGEDVAGIMAGWNYAGYLAGAVAVRGQTAGPGRYRLFALFLILSVASTAGMGLVGTPSAWHAMRFAAGFASGACFVLCSSIVLDTLAALNRPVLAGLLYSGVGTGIALGAFAAGPLLSLGGPEPAWLGMAALCLPLAAVGLFALRPGVTRTLPVPARGVSPSGEIPGRRREYRLLLTAYFLEGFGYIIGTTFLVAQVQGATGSAETARASWIITGCAAALSAPLWRYAARGGYRPILVLAFLLQGAGVLLPALSPSTAAALAGGLLLGGTFMGITVLSLQYGVSLSGRPSAPTIAVMTVIYGAGQIIGPFVAGFTAKGQGFGFAFALSSVCLFAAAGLLFAGNFRKTG